MSNYNEIQNIMDGYNPQRELREQTKKLVEKWEPTGLLEGIDEENRKHGMATLLENQARQLIDEASKVSTTANSEEWSGVALPLIRRIFGSLASQEFVSVQPMNLPSGLIFYLDFKYGSAQPGHTQRADVFGNTSSSGDPSGGLYGAGKFGYSINDVSANTTTATSGSATNAMIDFEPSLSGSLSSLRFLRFAHSELSNADLNGARAFSISGSGSGSLSTYYPAYTKRVDSDGTSNPAAGTHIQFIVAPDSTTTFDANGPAGDVTYTVKYHKQPTDITRGDFESSPAAATDGGFSGEGDVGIPEIDIQMRSIPIVAKTRKLKAVWTPELAQDLNAYHSVDAEAELTSMLSEYIAMEIDLEILDMIRLNANAKEEKWSAKVGYEWDGGSFVESSGQSNAYVKGTWFQTLGNKIQSVSNAIHQKTLRGGANFIVVSPEVATILESIPGYATDSNGDSNNQQYAMGVQKAGLLNNRFTVYKNPYQFENVILVGFRGSNFLETGAVYSPYVPLIMTPLVYDPTNFTPRKGVMTRYAKKIVRPEFYGTVVVADVDKV